MQLPVQSAGASFHAIIKKGNCRIIRIGPPKTARVTHVPWDDLANNTDRLVNRVTKFRGVDIDDLASVLVSPSSVVSESSGSFQDVEASGNGVGLAVVEGLQGGELVGVLFDQFGDLDEDLASLLTRDVF